VSDRERLLPPLRRAYNPGRANFEQPGQGGFPLELERLADAQLGITVADVSEMQPGLDRGFELGRQFTAAVAAQFGCLSITCPDGFYLDYLRNGAGGTATTITVTQAAPAFAALAGTFNRSGFPALIPRLTFIQGNLAAALGSQFFLALNQVLGIRLWVPPSFWLNLACDTANVQSDHILALSGTTLT
jgi:hypothetical protein